MFPSFHRSKLIWFLLSYLGLCSLFITSILLFKKNVFCFVIYQKIYLLSIHWNMERLNAIAVLLMFIGNCLLDHQLHWFRRRCQEFQSRTATKSDRMDSDGLECDFYRFHCPAEISSNCSPKETAIRNVWISMYFHMKWMQWILPWVCRVNRRHNRLCGRLHRLHEFSMWCMVVHG